MWISKFQVFNIKGFVDSGSIKLGRGINLVIGPNNAGKSTLLRCLNSLQNARSLSSSDVRKGSDQGIVYVFFEQAHSSAKWQGNYPNILSIGNPARIAQSAAQGDTTMDLIQGDNASRLPFIPSREPDNFIFPYSAKRKVAAYRAEVGIEEGASADDHLAYLPAKIDRIRDPQHPFYDDFTTACKEILGFAVSTFPVLNGKQAGLIVRDLQYIPLDAMGEGIGHLLGLITSLCVAQDNLFLIEEIENDIHPRALKALLNLIIKKSATNQFVISTHSNIVTKYLGGEPDSKVFYVSMEIIDRLPTSSVREVGKTTSERREVLEDLGYEFDDFNLWKAWLFLEEASAESIIRDYLIRWFTPKLQGKLRTLSANGVNKVEPKFEDFDRLFLFTHLDGMYHNRAWVVVDGDQPGIEAVNKLRERYARSGWRPNNFRTLLEEDFEQYYPERFAEKVTAALTTADRQQRRVEKENLVKEVLAWINTDEESARTEFETSASEVIGILREIEAEVASV